MIVYICANDRVSATQKMCPACRATCNKTYLYFRRCTLGQKTDGDLHSSDTTSLPGFENLTMGYNKYLRPYFGGMSDEHLISDNGKVVNCSP